MKKIFLENLPRRKMGNKLMIDWNNSIGYKVDFVYDDIEDFIEILDAKNSDITFKYKDNIYTMRSNHLKRCKLGSVTKKQTNEFRLNIGDEIKNEKQDFIITDRKKEKDKRGQNKRFYKYTCNNCGWTEGWMEEYNLLHGNSCGCCTSQFIVEGINDIPTTDPWMVKYFQGGYDEAKRYTYSSNKSIYPICPDCGEVKDRPMRICEIYSKKSIGCICGDGISYPNKFMANILKQLDIDFISEYSPEWVCGKRYDFYIPSMNLIIEMDGNLGHGNDIKPKYDNVSITKEIDTYKNLIAKQNGLKVIRINCKYKNTMFRYEYIKSNILKSDLNNYIDFKLINWDKANKYALSNKIKESCEFYEKHKDKMRMQDMAKELNISKSTLLKYIKQGSKVGWCNYDKKWQNKEVILIETGEIFESINECARELTKRYGHRFTNTGIGNACRGKISSHWGFHFKYTKDNMLTE